MVSGLEELGIVDDGDAPASASEADEGASDARRERSSVASSVVRAGDGPREGSLLPAGSSEADAGAARAFDGEAFGDDAEAEEDGADWDALGGGDAVEGDLGEADLDPTPEGDASSRGGSRDEVAGALFEPASGLASGGRFGAIEATLSRTDLFGGLLSVHLSRLARLAERVRYERGACVFRHGDPSDALYLIESGAVRISREVPGMGEEALAVLRTGSYFGEMAVVEHEQRRSADALVHERAILLRIEKQDLLDLMFVDRELAYELLWRFVRTLSERLRDANDRLLMFSTTSKF